jgi:hypothetical protein
MIAVVSVTNVPFKRILFVDKSKCPSATSRRPGLSSAWVD